MNCNDAREEFSRGGMGLTERALVHAHVMQCAECRKERESLSLVVSSRRRVAPSGATWLPRLRGLVSGRAAVRGLEGARVRLTRVLSAVVRLSERAAGQVIGATRSGMAISVALLTRLRVLLAMSLAVFGRAAVRAFEGIGAGFGRAAVRVVEVCQAGAPLVGRVRFAMARSAHLAFQGAARAAIEAARAGVTRVLAPLTRLPVWLSISFTVSARAAGRVVAASRAQARQAPDALIRLRGLPSSFLARSGRAAVKAIGATWAVGRVIGTPSSRVRPLLKVGAGIASLAVLLAALLASWPRPWWPDDLMARFSAVERFSPDVRRPVDRTPVEPIAAAPLVQTSAPKPVSAPRPATQTEIPAPSRRPDPSLARSRAAVSAPIPPTEAVQTAEASDSTAAIDWLLNGGTGRRRVENP